MTAIITREQFAQVEQLLDNARKRTRPRTHDLYDVLNAVLYRAINRCPWRQLPPGSPPWRTVHEYHTQWTMQPRGGGPTLLAQVLDRLNIAPAS